MYMSLFYVADSEWSMYLSSYSEKPYCINPEDAGIDSMVTSEHGLE